MSSKARILPFLEDSVERQGYRRGSADWMQRVDWMWDAWAYAIERRLQPFTKADILQLGHLVEHRNDAHDFRRVAVMVGGSNKMQWSLVPHAIDSLVAHAPELDPASLYREFEDIHPFIDGNGRVGEILYCWRLGVLRAPVRPPDFWGPQ